jgi:hypothetical protein
LFAANRRVAAMDVDRISSMGGVGQEQTPSWTREKMRRRKFAENVEPETDSEAPAQPAEQDDDHDGALDVIA